MAVDALAFKLEHLLARGELARSRLTTRDYTRLRGLFESGVLREERSGAGSKVVAVNPAALAAFVAREYPSGAAGIQQDLAPRSRAVGELRDAKRSRTAGPATVLLRGFDGCQLRSGDDVLPVASWTELAGVAALGLTGSRRWGFAGVLAVVENQEVFWNIEKLATGAGLALYGRGRLSDRVMAWLSSPAMAAARFIHLGDYDPVGLDEYLRLQAACPGRTELYLPPNLEILLQRYGKKRLLNDSTAVLARLRKNSDPQVARVVAMLDRWGLGLEQEALLLPVPSMSEPQGRRENTAKLINRGI